MTSSSTESPNGQVKKPLTAKDFLEVRMNQKLQNHPQLMEGYNCVYQFEIDDQVWNLDLNQSPPHKIVLGRHPSPDCAIVMSEESFQKLVRGKLNIALALVGGRIKIEGSKPLAMKLAKLFT